MKASELKNKYLDFFKKKGHAVIPSASLVPENDPTSLFTSAGMQPLVPYLMGDKHPEGNKLANIQRCVRTGDIDEVGDESHLTYFEMMGYWSLGSYWKKEAIEYIYEFLTEELKIDPKNFAVTCFEGDPKNNIAKDSESAEVWISLGIPEERIAYLGYEDNFWGPVGETGPCGPDSELFVWVGEGEATEKFDPKSNDWMELCNDVFMEYNKTTDGKYEPLAQKNVDFGMGIERLLAYLEGESDIYKTSIYKTIIGKTEELSKLEYGDEIDSEYVKEGKQCWVDVRRSFRIIADHLTAAANIADDGVKPSNTASGYILRRIIRRAVRYCSFIKINNCEAILDLVDSKPESKKVITEEVYKFSKTLDEGLKKAEKLFLQKKPIPEDEYLKIMQMEDKGKILGDIFDNKKNGNEFGKYGINISDQEIIDSYITGKEAFYLFQSFGFPIEMIVDLVQEKGLFVDIHGFRKELKKHQELSKTASAGMFKGGLADAGEETKKLHTTAHLMLVALKKVLGPEVEQKGSNITAERLRFDFNWPQKLTPEQIKEVEDIVNSQIEKDLPITVTEMSLGEAKKSGAHGTFSDKYGEKVKVYSIGDFSKEICGGPHVERTGKLGHFKIKKEQSSSAGIRRIKAVLE